MLIINALASRECAGACFVLGFISATALGLNAWFMSRAEQGMKTKQTSSRSRFDGRARHSGDEAPRTTAERKLCQSKNSFGLAKRNLVFSLENHFSYSVDWSALHVEKSDRTESGFDA
jgi:hypothetical protein